MSRQELADYLCVTKKAVEAWELGTRKPSGAVCRLLYLLETNQETAFKNNDMHYLNGLSFWSEACNTRISWKQKEESIFSIIFQYQGAEQVVDIEQVPLNNPGYFLYHKMEAEMYVEYWMADRQLSELLEKKVEDYRR